MNRRSFLEQAALATPLTASVAAQKAAAQPARSSGREYYELRRYHLVSGPQGKMLEAYLSEALIPALNRMGMNPVGAFNLYLGPETPCLYLLIPSKSLEALVTAELQLLKDDDYMKAGAAFLNAPAKEPAYDRIENSISIAFEGWPKLVVPPVTREKGARVFQLRTYESPSHKDHVRKVDMFNHGEFDVFKKAGFWPVFFGDTLVGQRLPQLTYMLSFPDLSELNAKWKAFSANPDWKKLSSQPEYNYEAIVSNISNLILNPTSYSQI